MTDSSWPIGTTGHQPEAYVTEGNEFLLEADSYATAHAWIEDMHNHQERVGEALGDYRIIPVVASPGGRDVR